MANPSIWIDMDMDLDMEWTSMLGELLRCGPQWWLVRGG